MNGLLKLATEAHGGVDRWNQLTELKAHLSVTGAYDYREVDGIKVPTTRRVVAFDDNKRKIPDPVLVAIDIREIAFS